MIMLNPDNLEFEDIDGDHFFNIMGYFPDENDEID